MEDVDFLIRDASFKERVIRVLIDDFYAIDILEPPLEDRVSHK
jgi:hypothetical protein